ncbi:streptomycin biosynthesis regulator [Nonomuraea sp. NPDC050786]|uniref:streptomycin biosynthesis regulator n=1 Tax=Nonomuraea sp. NPDC050786 TaxID=3154840 RepID=UPI0033E9B8BA
MIQQAEKHLPEDRTMSRVDHTFAVQEHRSSAPPKVQWVPIDSLLPGYSPRLDGEVPEHVHVLMDLPDDLPPILVHWPSMRVIDGMHRVLAAQLKQKRTIRAQFFEGNEGEAFMAAVKANVTHGLPLTPADREAAATQIIEIQPHASDRSIAAITGLGPRTVAAIRQRMTTGNAQGSVRIGRDGRVRPLSSADGRRMASEIIAKRPDASLREIAKLAGISPATVGDVRKRIARGEDPVPVKLRAEHVRPGAGKRKQIEVVGWDGEHMPSQDRASMLQNLRKDPSLRLNASGRKVLQWLFSNVAGPKGWEEVLHDIPAHSAYVVAEMARGCAVEWMTFAERLEQRCKAADEV